MVAFTHLKKWGFDLEKKDPLIEGCTDEKATGDPGLCCPNKVKPSWCPLLSSWWWTIWFYVNQQEKGKKPTCFLRTILSQNFCAYRVLGAAKGPNLCSRSRVKLWWYKWSAWLYDWHCQIKFNCRTKPDVSLQGWIERVECAWIAGYWAVWWYLVDSAVTRVWALPMDTVRRG